MAFSLLEMRTRLFWSMASLAMRSTKYGIVRSMQSFRLSVLGSLRTSRGLPFSMERIALSLAEYRTSRMYV